MNQKCCVLGCTSGYDSCNEKIHFFHPPNQKTVNLWQKALEQNNFKLVKTHSICHKHFENIDIIKQKTLSGIDGPIYVDLDCWMLVDGAIPKLFLGIKFFKSFDKPL